MIVRLQVQVLELPCRSCGARILALVREVTGRGGDSPTAHDPEDYGPRR